MSTDLGGVDADLLGGLADRLVDMLAKHRLPRRRHEDKIELLAVVVDLGPGDNGLLTQIQPPVSMGLQQRKRSRGQELSTRRPVRLRWSEHHSDAIGVRRPAAKPDGTRIEIDVLPCKSERLADAPPLHEAQGNGG